MPHPTADAAGPCSGPACRLRRRKGSKRIVGRKLTKPASALAVLGSPAEKLWPSSNNGWHSSMDPVDFVVATTSKYKRVFLWRGAG